jgi:hypothetical protein
MEVTMDKKDLIENCETWKDLVEQYKISGKSQVQFCKDNNVKPHQLNYYAQKFKQKTKNNFAKVVPESKMQSPIKKVASHPIDPTWLAIFLKELYARS